MAGARLSDCDDGLRPRVADRRGAVQVFVAEILSSVVANKKYFIAFIMTIL